MTQAEAYSHHQETGHAMFWGSPENIKCGQCEPPPPIPVKAENVAYAYHKALYHVHANPRKCCSEKYTGRCPMVN